MGNVTNIIAIICSPSIKCANDFLYYKGLNPKSFRVATDPCELAGFNLDTPIIFTYFNKSNELLYDKYRRLLDYVISSGFKSIRYMDY